MDEFIDFSRVHARSDGLTIDNTFNAMYAEYLFRSRGDREEWAVYRTAGEITSFKACGWFKGKPEDLAFQVSADGHDYQSLKPERREQAFPSPPGGAARGDRRTLVEYEGKVPPGKTFFKVLWTGPAEVDRLELLHAGG